MERVTFDLVSSKWIYVAHRQVCVHGKAQFASWMLKGWGVWAFYQFGCLTFIIMYIEWRVVRFVIQSAHYNDIHMTMILDYVHIKIY